MPIMLGARGILVKARGELPRAPFAIGGREGGAKFTAEPLFRSIGSEPGPGIAAASIWQVLTPMMPLDGDSVWDVCHALMNEGMGIEFAEPDVQQAWIIGDERDRALAAARACDAPEQQDQRYPTAPANNLWFQDDDHSEFAAAR